MAYSFRMADWRFLKPRTGFEFVILAAMVVMLGLWGVRALKKPAEPEKSFAPPEEIDSDLVRIHRAAEDEAAAQIVQRWNTRGYTGSIAAVYEFAVIRDKPVFYLGVVQGTNLDRRKVLEEEIAIFEGKMSDRDKMEELPRDGVSFLCGSFQRGTGLVALSAICVWDDGQTAGWGVRIAGGDIKDTLRYTAFARNAILNPPPPLPFEIEEPEPAANRLENHRDRAIRDIIASLRSYNCKRFNQYLPDGAEEMFREQIGENLLDRMKDPVERVCFVLSTLDLPRSETMTIRQRSSSADRAVLTLQHAGHKTIDFALLKTSDGWKVDAEWALKQVQDHTTRLSLLTFAMDQQGLSKYSDRSGVRSSWVPGMADSYSEIGKVYILLSEDSRFVCGSAISLSGELFLIRLDENKNASYIRGGQLPGQCPEKPLSPAW